MTKKQRKKGGFWCFATALNTICHVVFAEPFDKMNEISRPRALIDFATAFHYKEGMRIAALLLCCLVFSGCAFERQPDRAPILTYKDKVLPIKEPDHYDFARTPCLSWPFPENNF